MKFKIEIPSFSKDLGVLAGSPQKLAFAKVMLNLLQVAFEKIPGVTSVEELSPGVLMVTSNADISKDLASIGKSAKITKVE